MLLTDPLLLTDTCLTDCLAYCYDANISDSYFPIASPAEVLLGLALYLNSCTYKQLSLKLDLV